MAQASSAQREPSMEEILASIRRIIEDSETGHKDEGPEAGSVSANDAGDVETFRAEPKPAMAARPGTAAEEEEERQEVTAEETPAPRAFEWMRQGADEKVSLAAGTPDGAPASAPQGETDTASGARAESSLHDARGDERQTQSLAPVSQARSSESGQGILSEISGRKVAAAFDELNEAFEASRRKSLGDAAEEMLRPMLQEWLDNNLPQLVEKLVREEIERIARGA